MKKIFLFSIFIIVNFFCYTFSISDESTKKMDEVMKTFEKSKFTNMIVPSILGGRLLNSNNIKKFECTDKKNKKTLISFNEQSPESLQKYFPSVLEFYDFPNGALTFHIAQEVQEKDISTIFPVIISKAISQVYWDEDYNSWWWYESRITNQTPKTHYILYNVISDNYQRTKETVKYETIYFKLPTINNKVNQNLKKNMEIPFERYVNSYDYKEQQIGKNLYQEIDNYMLKLVNEEISIKNLINSEFDFIDKNSETFLKTSSCIKKDYFS